MSGGEKDMASTDVDIVDMMLLPADDFRIAEELDMVGGAGNFNDVAAATIQQPQTPSPSKAKTRPKSSMLIMIV